MFSKIDINQEIIQKYGKISNYFRAHFTPFTYGYTSLMQKGLIPRGNKKIPWIQSPGSIGIGFNVLHHNPALVGIICAFSIAQIINGKCKWPNDVYLNDKKIAGLMVFPVTKNKMVVGISLNLNNAVLDQRIKDKATSYYLATKSQYDYEEFASKLSVKFWNNLKTFTLDQYHHYSYLYGKKIKIKGSVYQFVHLNGDGSATFLKDGQKVVLTAFDISFNKG